MVRTAGLLLVLALASAASAGAPTGPLAPAAGGELQCYAPTDHKTCQALAGYTAGAGEVIENEARVLVSASPAVVMRVVSPVTLENDQVCGPLRPADVDAASFTVNGAAATADQTTQLRASLKQAMQAEFGHRACTVFAPDTAGGFLAKVSIDGVPEPKADQHVIWVKPSDGYTVGP